MSGTSVMLDSNIIMLLFRGHPQTQALILDNEITVSYITELEVLGY